MTARRACPAAAGPLEEYAASFDGLFASLAQRRGFREYLTGLLLPRERNKTLTALAGAEPVVGAQDPAVQRLQFFLSESHWDAEQVNDRRLELLAADAATAPHPGGVLVVDDSGDRKDGHATAHVARQYLGSVGKTDNGIVAVSTLWADERVYYPLHVTAYTPAGRLSAGRNDPDFATKPQIAANLVGRAVTRGVGFAAVVADSFYGPSQTDTLIGELHGANLPYVLALKPHVGTWAPEHAAHTPIEAAQDLGWHSQRRPGGWQQVTRRFRDGHTETWWAADARLGSWGPDRPATGCVTGPSRATSRSNTSWAGPTSRSVARLRSTATTPWCAARSPSAGRPAPSSRPTPSRRRRPPRLASATVESAGQRGGTSKQSTSDKPMPRWPVALRHIRAWLTPATLLQRYWQAWSHAPPPPQLQDLLTAVTTGHAIHAYLPP